jgi:hypothetical protein
MHILKQSKHARTRRAQCTVQKHAHVARNAQCTVHGTCVSNAKVRNAKVPSYKYTHKQQAQGHGQSEADGTRGRSRWNQRQAESRTATHRSTACLSRHRIGSSMPIVSSAPTTGIEPPVLIELILFDFCHLLYLFCACSSNAAYPTYCSGFECCLRLRLLRSATTFMSKLRALSLMKIVLNWYAVRNRRMG